MQTPIQIPGTTKRLCPHCSRAKDEADFGPGHAFCRSCDESRFTVETVRRCDADRRLEAAFRLLRLLNSEATPPEALTSTQKRRLRLIVIDAVANDPALRDTLLDDLRMLKARQERITHVSAAQDVEDVKSREGLNI